MINLKEALDKVKKIDIIPDIPMVKETPEGWPCYCAEEGKNWYEKAKSFYKRTGHIPLPSKWTYDEFFNVVDAKKYKKEHEKDAPKIVFDEPSEEIRQNGGFVIGRIEEE